MRNLLITPQPLSGPGVQFALLLPVFLLLVLCPWPRRLLPHEHSIRPVFLPSLQGSLLDPANENALVVTVDGDGVIFIGTRWYPPADLLSGLRERIGSQPQPHVVLRLDRRLSYGSIRPLFRALQAAGVSSVFLLTQPDEEQHLQVPLPVFRTNAT